MTKAGYLGLISCVVVAVGGALPCTPANAVGIVNDRAHRLGADHPAISTSDAAGQDIADRAYAASMAQDFVRSIELYQELIKLRPQEAVLHYNLGAAYYGLHDLERAIQAFTEAVLIKPDFDLAFMNRGNAFSQAKRYAEAVADFDHAIALKPAQFLSWYNRGIAKARQGDKAGALRDLDEAIRLQPDDARSYAVRGEVHEVLGERPAAIADYRHALQIDPGNRDTATKLERVGSGGAAGALSIVTTTNAGSGVASGGKKIADLALEACFKNGADEQGLENFAKVSGWESVGTAELKKQSGPASSMIGGWTFTGDVGAVAVMQSRENIKPPVHICSVTTQLAAPMNFGEVREAFERAAAIQPNDVKRLGADSNYGYWLAHTNDCETRISMVHSVDRNIVTVRFLHGRVRRPVDAEPTGPKINSW